MIVRERLLFNRFVKLIEENHQEITERFINGLLKDPDAAAYRTVGRFVIYDSSDKIYRELSTWITREYPKEKIEEIYTHMGKDGFSRGIPFPEVHRALVLQKRFLWLFIIERIGNDKIEFEEALELNNRVTLYFDRATFYILKAYHNMLNKKF